MASLKSIADCIGVDTGGTVSVLGHIFGFIRRRVPPDPDSGTTAEVSLLDHVRGLQGRHFNLNVIRVGFDTLNDSDRDTGFEKLDYAVYRTRNIFDSENLGLGRVQHWFVTSSESDGKDDLGSEGEADDLSDDWSVDNDGIDAFVVRNISDSDFVGISPRPGDCDKGGKDDGLIAGEIGRGFEGFSRTFAHEIGHFLNLSHNHGSNCPTATSARNNLMAQTRCSISTRGSVQLTSAQGNTVRNRCQTQGGC